MKKILMGLVLLSGLLVSKVAFADSVFFQEKTQNLNFSGCLQQTYYPCPATEADQCGYANNVNFKFIGTHNEYANGVSNWKLYCPTTSYQEVKCGSNEKLIECIPQPGPDCDGTAQCEWQNVCKDQTGKVYSDSEVKSSRYLASSSPGYGLPGGERNPSSKYCKSAANTTTAQNDASDKSDKKDLLPIGLIALALGIIAAALIVRTRRSA